MEKRELIILRAQNYSESSVIFSGISSEGEYLSFIAKGIRGRKKNRISPLIASLSYCTITYYPAKSASLHILKELDSKDLKSLDSRNPVVLCFRQFAAEVALKFCQQHPTNSEAFEISKWAIYFLQKADKITEFPLHYLRNLIFTLGLQPDLELALGGGLKRLDLAENQDLSTFRSASNSAILLCKRVLDNYEEEVVLQSGKERAEVLNFLVRHLQEQLPGFSKLKSLDVIREVLR